MGEFDVKVFDIGKGFQAYDEGVRTNSRLAEMARQREDQEHVRQQRSTLAQIGQAAASGDIAGARDAAFRGGNVDAGLKLDDRRREQEAKDLTDIGGAISAADTPEKFTAALTSIEQRRGLQPGALSSKYRFEHKDAILGEVIGATKMAELKAKETRAPGELERRAAAAGLVPGTQPYKDFMLNNGPVPKGVTAEADERRKAVIAQGHDPNSPQYQSYILTGRMPREDQQPLTATDKQAILEADEAVLSNTNAIKALTEAKTLSPQANSGYFASGRATLGNNLPDLMVPDRVSSPESSAATTNYENLVLGQALGSLKAIFGAAPTEGERKILLDLQASVGKPDHVRQEILDRAIGIAQSRLQFNQQRANELRGGTYYKPPGAQRPGGQPAPAQPGGRNPPPATSRLPQGVTPEAAIAEAKAAIAAGKDKGAIISRLQGWGIDAAGL